MTHLVLPEARRLLGRRAEARREPRRVVRRERPTTHGVDADPLRLRPPSEQARLEHLRPARSTCRWLRAALIIFDRFLTSPSYGSVFSTVRRIGRSRRASRSSRHRGTERSMSRGLLSPSRAITSLFRLAEPGLTRALPTHRSRVVSFSGRVRTEDELPLERRLTSCPCSLRKRGECMWRATTHESRVPSTGGAVVRSIETIRHPTRRTSMGAPRSTLAGFP
jgi:hypothetical protein